MVLPLSLLKTAQNHPMLIELKNGETYNGMLIACDSWMNVHLRDAICTSKEGDKFMKIPEVYVRGSTIKYLRIPDEVVELVKDEVKEVRRQQKENRTMKRNFAKGARGGGSGGGGGRPGGGPKSGGQRGGGHHQQRPQKNEQEEGQKIFKTSDGTIYELNELESKCSVLGQQLQEWSFPIFNFADKYKNTVLSRLTFAIFKEADLFKTFKISYSKFFNFFHALESGYWDIPYHNQIHAADVLHGCFYLTCHSVHAFYDYHQSLEEVDDEGEEIEEISKYSNNWEEISKRHQQQQQQQSFNNNNSVESTAIPLSQSMSALELMALYSAAAMHDYDHPGRTNAFLVASEDKKAILYNDRSVLENHHAAESWKLLTSQSSYNFIENLDSAETKRFRYLVLEYILATDLKQHFDIIVQFNERAPSMDLSNESDRMLISLMIIKFADINSPAKPFSLHKQWTERICQEFYEQGDEERLRNMAISPYMDRSEPAVAKLQDSFIAHIVNPLAIALNEANLLPILPGLPESELIINLRHNHQKWLNQIEFDQKFCREGEDGEGNALEKNKTNIFR
ncbi:unnamed protein product [Meloidogyne enterolobii]|uniref:Uncharacterized protein n=1 Tax=Meloidogyne enterolobii TaxID=390850 RepID=A0ACB0YFZ8_MELEN